MEREAKIPEDTPQWEAIDIFVFSNGQKNSPPRKYHLRIDDLSWWKATLKFLGKQQYGSTTSIIELYTIEGRKVKSPLELSHGTFYVAVEPTKAFVDAGYEKYLIRASKSWEKRQAQKSENEKTSGDPEKEQITQFGETKTPQEESVLLNTIISSLVENESSVVVSPLAVPNSEQKPDTQTNVTTIKSMQKKRISIQRPAIVRTNNANVNQTVTNTKPPFKRSSLRSGNNVKISKLENDRGMKSTQLPVKKVYKPTINPKVPPIAEKVTSNVHKEDEVVKQNSINVNDNKNKDYVSAVDEIKNAAEGKNVIGVSNMYENPQRESPSITDDLLPVLQNTRNNPEETNNVSKTDSKNNLPLEDVLVRRNDNSYDKPLSKVKAETNYVFGDSTSSRKISTINVFKNTISRSQENIIVMKKPKSSNVDDPAGNKDANNMLQNRDNSKMKSLFNEPHQPLKLESQENPINLSIERRINILNDKENVKYAKDVSQKNNADAEISQNDNELQRQKLHENGTEGILITNTDEVHRVSSRISSHLINQALKQLVVNDVENNLNKSDNNDGSKLCTSKYLNEKYIVNKGDTVNLKLNIEIIKDGNSNSYKCDNEAVKSDTSPKEKASQINIASNNMLEKRSLVSLVVHEIGKHHKENHNVIVIQCTCCKQCADLHSNLDAILLNKNVLLPCHESKRNSVFCPVKAVASCLSLDRLRSEVRLAKPNESVMENIKSDQEVITQKSVIIISDTSPNLPEVVKEISTNKELVHVKKVDNFTQTDWCNLLLEMKLESNVHYSLPSLGTLKYYKLL